MSYVAITNRIYSFNLAKIHKAEAVSEVLTFNSSIPVFDLKILFWLEEKADYVGYGNQ